MAFPELGLNHQKLEACLCLVQVSDRRAHCTGPKWHPLYILYFDLCVTCVGPFWNKLSRVIFFAGKYYIVLYFLRKAESRSRNMWKVLIVCLPVSKIMQKQQKVQSHKEETFKMLFALLPSSSNCFLVYRNRFLSPVVLLLFSFFKCEVGR